MLNNATLNKIKDYKNTLKYKRDTVLETEKSKDKLNKNLKSLIAERTLKENLVYSCDLLLKKLVANSKSRLESFLTFAIKRIFTDRDYEIRLILKEETKRPGLDLVLVENGIEQPMAEAVGGGILSTVGLLLQIYYIEVYNLNRILFIDEGLKEISKADPENENSKDYLEEVLAFLKWLGIERHYTFVVVTHDTDVITNADKLYRVVDGEVFEIK